MRQLVNIIGFSINETELASVEARVNKLAKKMSFALTIPTVMFGKSILQASNRYDTLRLTVETFASSQEEANKVVGDLIDLAKRLPTLSMKDLNEEAGRLIGQGVGMGELVSTLEMLATIAGATGGNMQNLAKAYMDVQRAGKLQGQEVLQFKNANVPIWDLLSKSTGKSIEQLKKEKASFEDVKKALMDFGGKGSKAADIMFKKGELLKGQWLKFLDVLEIFKVQLGKKLEVPLFTVLRVIEKITATLMGLDGNWKRFFVIGMAVMAIIPPLILLKSLLTSYLKPLAIISGLMAAISLAVDDIYTWVKGGKSVMGVLFGDYDQYKDKIKELKETFFDTFKDFKGTIESLGKLVNGIVTTLSGKSVTVTFLDTILSTVKQLLLQLDMLAIALRFIFVALKAPFTSATKTSADLAKIKKSMEKNAESNIAIKAGFAMYDMIDWLSTVGDKPWDSFEGKNDKEKMDNFQKSFSGRDYANDLLRAYDFGKKQTNTQTDAITGGITIQNLNIANTSGTPAELRQNIKLGFEDMFKSVIRKGGMNYSPMPAR